MQIHECVSFLVVENNKVLLEKRSILKVCEPGIINIPGGHVEAGESQIETLFRELNEELNIKPKSYIFLCSLYHPTSELQLIHYYVISAWSGEVQSLEADEVCWYDIDQAPLAIRADRVALSEYKRLSSWLLT